MTVMPLSSLNKIAYKPQESRLRRNAYSSRSPRPRRSGPKKWGPIIAKILGFGILIAGAGAVVVVGLFVYYSRNLPDPSNLTHQATSGTTKIYDRTGQTVLYELSSEVKDTPIKMADLPPYVKNAVIAAEDHDFYNHRGFDIKGIARALLTDIIGGGSLQGGSTITQQLVKNTITGNEKSISRKIKELLLAYRIEQNFSKDQILELYLNSIPYGSNAYGVEAASELYFQKTAKQLTIAEAATLAAMEKAPTALSPYGNNKDALIARQQYVIGQMQSLGYITADEATQAKAQQLSFSPIKAGIIAPHFVFYIKQYLADKYGEDLVERGGLKVITTLDLYKQKIAEEEISAGATKNATKYDANNAALVSLDPKTGQILAMVGSKDYFDDSIDGQVNVAVQPRQPGSSFKPIVYAAAFSRGFTPSAILYDVITTFKTDTKDYRPLDYDGKERGPVTIRQALAGSLNIPAVKTLYMTGVDYVLSMAQQLGYTTFTDRSRFGLSLVLGGAEVSLLEHTAAYQVFAREGVYHKPTGILSVQDSSGQTLEQFSDQPVQAIDNNVAREVTSILTDNSARAFIFGANSPLQMGSRPVGAKTGTTNDFRDGWTIGFTPSLVTGVWTGNNDNHPFKKGSDGVVTAAPIWNKYMSRVLGNTPPESFRAPDPVPLTNPALQGQVPGQETIYLDKVSGKRATDLTPPEDRVPVNVPGAHSELYYIDPANPTGPSPVNPANDPNFNNWESAVQGWLSKHQQDQAQQIPTDYDDVHTLANIPNLVVTSPVENDTLRGAKLSVTVVASAARGVKTISFTLDGVPLGTQTASGTYSLAFPPGTTPGFHTLEVSAIDDVGNKQSVDRTFNYIP